MLYIEDAQYVLIEWRNGWIDYLYRFDLSVAFVKMDSILYFLLWFHSELHWTNIWEGKFSRFFFCGCIVI